jgi:exonuclease III
MKYCTFNIEDFVAIANINSAQLTKFKEMDIILIQEWKEKEGEAFIVELNKGPRHYVYKSKDRVAIIFDDTFKLKKAYGIELLYEPPHIFETLYTKGRKKKNMMVLLEYEKKSLCVINCHLHAYSAYYHPGFHKKQLSKLLKDSLKKLNIETCGIIIGGDMNYRSNDLIKLIDNPITKYGELKDVCRDCKHINTHTFSCIHEKGLMKKLAKRFTRKLAFLQDGRLDFMATNLVTNYKKTKIIKMCSLSDHSAIFAESV